MCYLVKSVQSTLNHLISTSVPHTTFTCFFSWSMDQVNAIFIGQIDRGVRFHNVMNNLKPLTFKSLLSMKSQLNVNS